jgi:hypothetical protein
MKRCVSHANLNYVIFLCLPVIPNPPPPPPLPRLVTHPVCVLQLIWWKIATCSAWFAMRILFTRLKIRSALPGIFSERKRKDALPMSACLPLCPSARNNSAFTGPIFVKFVIWEFYTNLSNRLKFGQNLDKNNSCFTRKPTSPYSVTRNSILFLEKLVDPQCEINRT